MAADNSTIISCYLYIYDIQLNIAEGMIFYSEV